MMLASRMVVAMRARVFVVAGRMVMVVVVVVVVVAMIMVMMRM